MATRETAWRPERGPVRYPGGDDEVRPGDRVALRRLWWWRPGTVNHVPGVSPPHAEMEIGGLYWGGVGLDNGTFTGVIVDPDSGRLQRGVRLIERGDARGAPPVPPAPFE